MSANNGEGYKPKASEIIKTKPKTETKQKPSQSSENKPFSERLHDIKDKITTVFTKRELSNQPPSETLKDLSVIEIPQDTSKQTKPITDQTPENNSQPTQETEVPSTVEAPPINTQPEKSPEPKSIIPDTTKQDQAEITQLTQAIQNLKEPSLKSVETPKKKPLPLLYTDGPTLYDKFSKGYSKERRSFFGAIHRHSEINQLKKAGVEHAAKIYDALRSRGIPGHSIIRELNENTRSLFNEFYDTKTLTTPTEKNDLLQKAATIIDRLDSINCYHDFSLENLSTDQTILTLDNQQFQQRRQQIQSLFFLDRSSIISYLSNPNPDPRVETFISYLTSDFITNQNLEESFDTALKYTINNILKPNKYSDGYTTYNIKNFIQTAICSNLNPDQPIKIPEDLIPQGDYHSQNIIRLNNLSSRQHQRFTIEDHHKEHSYFTDSGGYEMFTNSIPNINFYRQFLFSEINQGQKITIPQAALDLINNPAQKVFHQNVSNLENPHFQKICINNSRGFNTPNYFSETGQPNANLLADYLIQNRQLINSKEIPDISTEDLSILSTEDQGKIKIIQACFELEDKLGFVYKEIYYRLMSDVGQNYDNFNLYHNQENQPNLLFFKKALSVCTTPDQIQKLISIIKDQLPTFSGAEKNFCGNVFSLKESSDIITQFIINLSDTTPTILFNNNGYPTNELFKSLINGNVFNPEFFTANLTPEIINSFPLQEQLFWKGISQLKIPNYQIIYSLLLSNMYEGSSEALFNQDGTPQLQLFETLARNGNYNPDFFTANMAPDIITSLSPEDQIFWKGVFNLKGINPETIQAIVSLKTNSNPFFNQDETPQLQLFETLARNGNFNPDFFAANLTPEVISSFSQKEQRFWRGFLKLKNINQAIAKNIISFSSDSEKIFTQDNNPTSLFFELLAKNGLLRSDFFTTNFTPETINSFSSEEQKLWNNLIQTEYINNQELLNLLFSENKNQFIKKGELTPVFYQEFANSYPLNFIKNLDKNSWKIVFGDELINKLLDSLPELTDEKRNAFTHNPYDRTSEFFEFLWGHSSQTNFKLDIEHLQIASEYIKKCGLAKSAEFYNYFQSLYLYQQGNLETLPDELIDNHITSIEELTKSMETVQKKCFGSKPIINVSELSPFELNLLSITTGHSTNRWTRIPLETIISDFSTDLSNGQITPLLPEFHPETINLISINIETDKQINDSPKLTTLRQEILNAINSPNDISSETRTISELFNQRINNLSKETQQTDPSKTKKQEFIQKQIDSFKQKVSEISESKTTDQLLNALITFNLNLGEDQEKFNSILRQLVFKKVFNKHQNSPGWQESIITSLREDSSTVDAVNNMTNLVNNTIKDHVLNFETKNQDGYWSESTFETVKKYSAVFKKNLGFSSFINELNSYQKSFIINDLNQQQTIEIVPDRGLMGEMSGYMADVCYTKVYPLLKQYPNLTPYKFISNPESESPEFIGSTLVFKVDDTDNQPTFLIRAFDLPNEQSIDVGKFFESFVDHLIPIAQKMGIKKIIAAGTPGTISNYTNTTNYVLSNYVNEKSPVRLKEPFDFNGYNITNSCYLIRSLL